MPTHLDGRAQVITVHGPSPPAEGNADPLPRWRDILTALLSDCVARDPERLAPGWRRAEC